MNFLFEDEDQDQNSKGLRGTREIILVTKNTPIEQVEDALLNLSNYGQYVPYQLKVNPSIKPKIAKILGPTGSPQAKRRSNEKEWDSSGREWRLAKAKDIQDRTDMDAEGWEDLRYSQLPKEAKDPNVFYTPSTADGIIKATIQASPKSDILRWEENNGVLVFPKKVNPVIPNDETLEKVLQTVMDNAGIKDSIVKRERVDVIGKDIIKFDPIDLPPVEDYQADLLEFEIEDIITKGGLNYSHLKISPLKSNQTNKVILSISGFRNKKEREKTEVALNKMKSELLENRLKFEFQRRAGIIK